jgi:hypothetical protein
MQAGPRLEVDVTRVLRTDVFVGVGTLVCLRWRISMKGFVRISHA